MGRLKELYIKTKKIAVMYTGIFVAVMVLNQLLFFGLCLNPICLVAAMPHVLFITVIIGMWLHKPTYRKIKKTLKFVRESYDEVKSQIEQHRENYSDQDNNGLFTGNVYLFVTQNKSKGEDDFQTVLDRYKKPKIVSKTRLDNRHKSKALLEAIRSSKHHFKAGDIVAIVRGGGDTNDSQFDSYKDSETCNEVRYLADQSGVITVSGIGHSTDNFPIERAVNFAQITPTDAAMQVAFLINGKKWKI
jgi:hypothetical protein